MIIAALKSNISSDNRSPIHIETIYTLLNLDIEIWFEERIGDGINVSDKVFEDTGLKKHTRDVRKGKFPLKKNFLNGTKYR